MKAAVFYGPGRPLKVEDLPVPEIGSRDVLIKLQTCGICRGDVQRMSGQIKVKTPIVLGHEPAGTIAQMGKDVQDFHEGDKVFAFAVGCGECYYCRIGKDNVCERIAEGFGLGRDGGYAEYMKASPRELFMLPEGLPFEGGSVLTASTGTVFHAIRLAQVVPGDTVAIYGTGCLGTQAVQLLDKMGARVIAIDIVDEKLEMARKLGADVVVNALLEDPVRTIRSHTEGRGADVALEVAGLPKTMLQAIDSVRKGGRIMDIGSLAEPVALNMALFADSGLSLSKEVSLTTVSHCSREHMIKLQEFMAVNKLDFNLGTVRVPLSEINDGFRIKRDGKGLRVVITMS